MISIIGTGIEQTWLMGKKCATSEVFCTHFIDEPQTLCQNLIVVLRIASNPQGVNVVLATAAHAGRTQKERLLVSRS